MQALPIITPDKIETGLDALPRECRFMIRSYLTATESLRHFLALENMKIFVGAERAVLRDNEHQQKRDTLLEAYNRQATQIITMTRLGLLQDAEPVREALQQESLRLRKVMQQNETLYLICIQNLNARVDSIMQRIEGSANPLSDVLGDRHVTH